jgi:ATP synthase I chain
LHAKYLIVLALAFAGSFSYGFHAAWSLALGGAIQVLNLAVLERSVRALLSAGGETGNLAPVAQLALLLRTVLFFTAVIYVLTFTSVRPLAFLAGLLVIVPAAVWHGLAPSASAR